MKVFIKNIITLPSLILSFKKHSKLQKNFIQRELEPVVRNAHQYGDETLEDEDFRKITSHYGWAVPAILGESFCVLRGKAMTETERSVLTYLGALTGLFDDMFDKNSSDPEHLQAIINDPSGTSANNSRERMFMEILVKVLENKKDPALKEAAQAVFAAQVKSSEQTSQTITRERIRNITLEKGGSSLIFYRCAFHDPMDSEEYQMLYTLGGLGQLTNDLFDVYEDYHSGIHTLVTMEEDIHQLGLYYSSLLQETINLVSKTGYPTRAKRQFSRIISLVACRGLVCLDYLKRAQYSNGNIFDVSKYKRSELICDMEKGSHLLKALSYYAQTKVV